MKQVEYEVTYRKVKKQYIKVKQGSKEERDSNHNGYTQVINTMMKYIKNNSQFKVYCYLCSLWNEEYNYSFPSISHMASELSMSRKTIVNALKGLEELGYIKKVKNNKESGYANNIYYIYYIHEIEVKRERYVEDNTVIGVAKDIDEDYEEIEEEYVARKKIIE